MKFLRALVVLVLLALVLLAVLAWTAPAEVAYRYVRDRLGPIALSGISGSVWQGRAEQVTVLGHGIGALDWQLRKSPLLSRRAIARLELGGAGIDAQARIDATRGVVRIEGLTLELPAAMLGPALDIPALVFEGRVVLDVPEAELTGGYLTRARGSASWKDIGVQGAAVARMPGIRAEFEPAPDGSIVATVRDLGGALAIDGRVVIRDGKFESETRLSLREPSPQLGEMLKFIGERTADGASILRVHGELKKLW